MYVCICWTPAVSVTWLLMERHLSLLSHWSSAAQTVNDVDLGSAGPRLNIKGYTRAWELYPRAQAGIYVACCFAF